jgi:hypothetical protein
MTKTSELSRFGFFADAGVPPLVYSGLLSTFGYLTWGTAPGSLITNHEERAAGLLIEQFQYARDLMDRPSRTSQTLRKFVKQLQDVENAGSDFTSAFNLYVATGAQLDVIGRWVGVAREGMSDDELRNELYYQIAKNQATGAPELIIETLQRISGATVVQYTESYPAKVILFVNDAILTDTDENIQRAVQTVMPAGVGLTFVNGGGGNVFSTDFDETTLPDYALGFDELDYLEAGVNVGGRISELIIA